MMNDEVRMAQRIAKSLDPFAYRFMHASGEMYLWLVSKQSDVFMRQVSREAGGARELAIIGNGRLGPKPFLQAVHVIANWNYKGISIAAANRCTDQLTRFLVQLLVRIKYQYPISIHFSETGVAGGGEIVLPRNVYDACDIFSSHPHASIGGTGVSDHNFVHNSAYTFQTVREVCFTILNNHR